jgi:hypothetical protein
MWYEVLCCWIRKAREKEREYGLEGRRGVL